MNTVFHGIGAALIISLSVVAHAGCPTVDPLHSPIGLEVIGVQSSDEGGFQSILGIHRLGLNGERIASPDESPNLILNRNKVEVEPIWQTLVDWSVYKKPDEQAPFMRLYFSHLPDGSRQLCRMESLEYGWEGTRGRVGVNKLVVAAVFVYFYKKDQQIEKVAIYKRNAEGTKDRVTSAGSICYRYGVSGRPMARFEASGGNCQVAKLKDVHEIFVSGKDGKILRKITNVFASSATVVEIFDADGAIVKRYENGGQGGPHASAADEEGQLPEGFVVDQNIALQIGGAGYPWRIVLARPEYARRGWYLTLRDEQRTDGIEEVLATGITDPNGMLTPVGASAERVISLVHQYPGRVLAQWGDDLYQLWPVISQKSWEACVDPLKDEASDCD